MLSATVVELIDVVGRLEIAVDADDLVAVYRARELLLAKSMAPLREFDKAQLYQLSKARSTKQFLQRTAGLSSADAGSTASLSRKLGAIPQTEARFVDGKLPSGHVRAIAANVSPRLVDRYQAVEGDLLDIFTPLSPLEAASAMNARAIRANALVDDDEDKAPRSDEFFHSKTLGGRYVSKGASGPQSGATIAEAIALALLITVARAEGVHLDKEKGGWSREKILVTYRQCLAAVKGGPQEAAPLRQVS